MLRLAMCTELEHRDVMFLWMNIDWKASAGFMNKILSIFFLVDLIADLHWKRYDYSIQMSNLQATC